MFVKMWITGWVDECGCVDEWMSASDGVCMYCCGRRVKHVVWIDRRGFWYHVEGGVQVRYLPGEVCRG